MCITIKTADQTAEKQIRAESGLSQDAQPPLHIPWFTVGVCKKQTHNNCLVGGWSITGFDRVNQIYCESSWIRHKRSKKSVLQKPMDEPLDGCEQLDEKVEANQRQIVSGMEHRGYHALGAGLQRWDPCLSQDDCQEFLVWLRLKSAWTAESADLRATGTHTPDLKLIGLFPHLSKRSLVLIQQLLW